MTTLPETNSLAPENVLFPGGPLFFGCENVSFRGGSWWLNQPI